MGFFHTLLDTLMLHIRRDLPTGKVEPDDGARLKAWAQVQDKAGQLMGVTPYGLDPDVTFSDPNGRRHLVLTPEAAVALAAAHDRLSEAGLLSA